MSSHWCQDCGCENGWRPSADVYVAWKTFKLKSCAFAIFIDFSNFLCLLFTLWTKKVKQPSNHWGEWLFAKMAEHVLNPFWWVSNAFLTPGLWPDPKIIGLSRILRIHYSVLAWFQLSHLQCCWSTIFLKTSKFKMLLVIANFLTWPCLLFLGLILVSREKVAWRSQIFREPAVVLICIQHRRFAESPLKFSCTIRVVTCSVVHIPCWFSFSFSFLIKIYFGKSLSKLIEKNKWVEVGIYFLLLQIRDYFNDSGQYSLRRKT